MAGNAKKQPEKPAETDSKKSTSTRFLMFRFSPEKRGAAIKVFIAGVLALLMFSQVISSYMQLNEVYSSISDANSELSNLRSENVRMQTELEGKASIRNIKETVAKDIAFGPRNMGLAEEEVQARVQETAAIVGLSEEILKQSPFLLSGGQKRRVAIAGVMAMRPEVLILDEPTAGLDPRGREEILQEIQAYRNQTGATILLVSHSTA